MKNTTVFMQNKPNSPIVQTDVTFLATINYAIFASLTKVKNKPNQTQFKANTNPIFRMAKFALSSFITSKYEKVSSQRGKKTNPIQSQYKPNWSEAQVLPVLSLSKEARSNGPIASKTEMSLKSLAGKSGHSRKNLDSGLSLIILLTIFNMPAKRQIFGFPQGGVPLTQLWVLR